MDKIEEGQLGLTYREGQANMALDIAEAFCKKQHLMIEASVGIGKSFGYLIPALIINKLYNKPIIIATSSIHLSEQLLGDTNFIADKLLGRPVRTIVGKGKEHYTCFNRAIYVKNSERDPNLNRLIHSVFENRAGERSKFDFDVSDSNWSKINVDRCLYERCDHRSECQFYNMRTGISDYSDRDIIIVNQDLLIADLILKQRDIQRPLLNTQSPLIIIDEAHNLETKIRSALTITWSEKTFSILIKQLFKTLNVLPTFYEIKKTLNRLNIEMLKIVKDIQNQLELKKRDPQFRDTERFAITFPSSANQKVWKYCINELSVALTSLDSKFSGYGNGNRVVDGLTEELDQLFEFIIEFPKADLSANLFWATTDSINIEIHMCPKNSNEFLKKTLFTKQSRVILTSATICQPGRGFDNKYKYMANSIGFNGSFAEPQYADYNYKENCRLYIANDLPAPQTTCEETKTRYYTAISERIRVLADITDGRTLVLFTSKEDMRQIHRILESDSPIWPVMIQKEGPGQNKVLREFREKQGVLLGTGVFWEGLDIKGDDLSQVIIVRLPFPVPDPILDYKITTVEKRNDVLIPEMLTRLRQGAGRLIRSETDKGVLSILDSRLSSLSDKDYREMVLEALPIRQRTENIEDIKSFVQSNIVSSKRLLTQTT
ncbi:ATP-dependent DNA helicase [Paenibacillus sp. MMS18-CY102]|uniref:ATP-dependent DNA helicase n=1 Tax=Paenibacillus sp. MMS18-CY102 TaxID=2682849 RepID=UPI001F1DF799|nr:ATP-dependent DNA helicase [Paenibacillus sp. MMS18-CY102]